jgi:hypothetical protein
MDYAKAITSTDVCLFRDLKNCFVEFAPKKSLSKKTKKIIQEFCDKYNNDKAYAVYRTHEDPETKEIDVEILAIAFDMPNADAIANLF